MMCVVEQIIRVGMDYAVQALWVVVSWTQVVGLHEVILCI
jgi:hypothetical protein